VNVLLLLLLLLLLTHFSKGKHTLLEIKQAELPLAAHKTTQKRKYVSFLCTKCQPQASQLVAYNNSPFSSMMLATSNSCTSRLVSIFLRRRLHFCTDGFPEDRKKNSSVKVSNYINIQ
jgi:hypothetical protein